MTERECSSKKKAVFVKIVVKILNPILTQDKPFCAFIISLLAFFLDLELMSSENKANFFSLYLKVTKFEKRAKKKKDASFRILFFKPIGFHRQPGIFEYPQLP